MNNKERLAELLDQRQNLRSYRNHTRTLLSQRWIDTIFQEALKQVILTIDTRISLINSQIGELVEDPQ